MVSELETASVGSDMETRYAERLKRYVTAMRNEKPDRVPIRPFVAEFTGTYTGFTCQELCHDYQKAFDAACICAAEFDWDAVVANMVYVWTGLAQVMDLEYYAIPGIHIPADTGFQYREPPLEGAFMRSDEYDALIEDPTGFLYNVWFPRVAGPVQADGDPVTFEHNMALLKGGMAMMQYFNGFPAQVQRLRAESGTVSAIAGIFKAPMDIIADKMRGYLGLVDDLHTQPDKVVAACEALMPHLYNVAKTTADPMKQVPIGYWMHRGCVPFISFDQFDNIYWATTRPIIEQLWADGHQTLFYAEGNWDHHLKSFAELPDRSIVYHVDQGDIFKAHEVLGEKFCLSGGVSNTLLGHRPPEEVREIVKKILEGVARDGGYIMDASAIVQNDAKIENMKVMTETTREFGVYSSGVSTSFQDITESTLRPDELPDTTFLSTDVKSGRAPGTCVAWERKKQELPKVEGDVDLIRSIWQGTDALANMFIWQMLLSF